MKRLTVIFSLILMIVSVNAKTLIVYYSFSNNIHRVVTELQTQIQADILRIEPQEKGLDYAANNYAIGSALISDIRQNPNSESSYPAIDPVNVNLSEYDMIIVAAPLWWSNMAAPLQTFLFRYGSQMENKNIAMIVSSASSGISGVVGDAKRLIPNGNFLEPNLWIRSSQVSNSRNLISTWLQSIDYDNITSTTLIDKTTDISDIDIVVKVDEINIIGEFDSVSIYNIEGNKLLETNDNIIKTTNIIHGIYIAYFHKNGYQISKKFQIVAK